MHVVVAGGSGFLGRALVAELRQRRTVKVLTRRPRAGAPDDVAWAPDGTAGPWAQTIEGAHAVVNLAGESIADRRWTAARKAALRASRLDATRSLVAAIAAATTPPAILVSASGVGYYGFRGDEILDERAPAGDDFLATLCVEWESAARAASARTNVAIVRSGLVLDRSGGALKRMLLPFTLGVGGPIGSGRQYFPWIHRADWVRLVAWLVDRTPTDASTFPLSASASARGASADTSVDRFNATAPETITNAEFARALGRALHRPAILPVPAFALRLALGELADALLTGQRPVPAHAQELGFTFNFPTIKAALEDLFPDERQPRSARRRS